jgi:ATP-dependent helicase/DNAse subunit B
MAVSEALTAPAEMNCLEFLDELLGTFDSTPVDPLTGRLEKSIFIGRFLEARGLRFKAAAILGLSEGIFPEIERADPFLSETLRDRFHLERRLGRYQASLFYQIVTRADETLMLCRPYLAEGGETWIASHTWQNIHRLFSQEASPYPVIRIRAESLREVTQAASCAEALFYAARRGLNPAHDPDLEREAARLDTLRPVLAARLAEKAEGPYEGHPAQLAGLTGEFNQPGFTWSATHLETYGSCPFRYFVQHSLHLVPKLPPEPGLDAAQLGSLYHAILERAYQFASDPAEPDSVIHSLREQAAKIFELAPQYFTFIPDPLWEQQQAEILSRLEKTVQALADISQGWQPMAYEQSFGYGASPALELATGTGKIRLRGFIDRLDRDNQGRTRLIDYKTGSSGMEAKDLLEGRRLQLPLYALAASQALGFGEVVDGFYWSIHETKPHLRLAKFEEGALSGAEGATTVALDYVDRYVSNIHSAFFPPRPPAAGCPEYCPASLWCWRYSPSAW